ncbi:hypothetical protein FPV67DRAFT_428551 [Lyophyllum atratum]|nr:hypothetical protein FPV67DRAFT_428551 [Lyophyllum atratum]
MLSYGFKYGEPWGEDRRAIERAFHEADIRSNRDSGRAWTASNSVDGSTYGGTLSTMSSVSTMSSGGSGRYSVSSQDRWRGSERAHSRSGSQRGGMEVVRVGGGNEASRSMSSRHSAVGSERASNIPTWSYPRRDSDNGSISRVGGSPYSGRGYEAFTTRPTYETSHWNAQAPYGQHRGWGNSSSRDGQSSSSIYGPGTEENSSSDGRSGGSFGAQGTYTGSFGHDHRHADDDDTHEWDDFSYERESGYAESVDEGSGGYSEYGSGGSEVDSYISDSDGESEDSYDDYSD